MNRDLTTTLTSMTPSPSFPANLQQSAPVPTNNFFNSLTSAPVGQPIQPPLNLNNSFLSGLGQIPSTNRVPMNQMRPAAQPPLQTPLFMQPSANLFNNTNANQSNQEKKVSLSAQEINDFLS